MLVRHVLAILERDGEDGLITLGITLRALGSRNITVLSLALRGEYVPPIPKKPFALWKIVVIAATAGPVVVLVLYKVGKRVGTHVWTKYLWKPRPVSPSEAVLRDTSEFVKRARKAGGEIAWA